MKQNNLEDKSSNNKDSSFKEVNLISELLISVYKDFEVSKKRIYEVALFLYSNGVRSDSFSNGNIDKKEIDCMYKTLISKYSDLFDLDYIKIYGVSIFLGVNGIKNYMFNDKKLDIEEIVRYLASRRKCIKFSNIDNNDIEVNKSNNEGSEVINILDYLSVEKDLKRRIRR